MNRNRHKLPSSQLLCLLILSISIALASCVQTALTKELDEATVHLMDAAIHSDLKEVMQAKERLEKILNMEHTQKNSSVEARIHYEIAFAGFQAMYITFGQIPEGRKLMEESLDHLQKASTLDPEFSDVYVLSALCSFYLSRIDRENDSHQLQIPKFIEKARQLSPDSATLATAEAFMTFRGDPAETQKKIQRAWEIAEQEIHDGKKPDWWNIIPYHYIALNYYYRGELMKAREPVEQALALRPDLEVMQSTLVPLLQPKHPVNPALYSHLKWTQLAVDAAGDGQNPELADARALSYSYDAAKDRLWFNFDYNSLPDPSAFGINIAVDIDDNQENGTKWWGGNTTFHFDRLVTVWVRKYDDGNYYGTVGISDDVSVRRMRLMQLSQNNILFGADAQKQQVLIGFQRSELDTARKIRLLAAVGSDLVWNDNIPDANSVTIQFSQEE